MLFKDRVDAGNQLSTKLRLFIAPEKRKMTVIVSLLRGGYVVGYTIAKELAVEHIPLVTIKISSPFNREYAIGALCRNLTYFDPEAVTYKEQRSEKIKLQIQIAKTKKNDYEKKFGTDLIKYQDVLKNKVVILVDDGAATGSTVKAAKKFIDVCNPEAVYLALPVCPINLDFPEFDKIIILHQAVDFYSVSQFYERFPQLTDEEILKFFRASQQSMF